MLADSLPELLATRARIHPERPALVDARTGATLSYGELHRSANAVADRLAGEGIRAGDRITLLCDQTIDAWQVLYGAMSAGAVPVLANWRLAPGEIAAIVADSRSTEVLSTSRWSELAEGVADGLGLPARSTRELVTGSGDAAGTAAPRVRPDDIAVQMYTSGTTSLPKGVCSTHLNLLALLDTLSSELPGFAADSRHLVAAPLFHIAGFGFGIGPLAVGAPAVLLGEFDPAAVLDAIEQHHITHSLLVPAMLQAVVGVPGSSGRDTSSLRGILYGGSPISRALLEQVDAVLGCPLTQAYGLTETSGIATMLRFDDHRRGLDAAEDATEAVRLASAGRPIPGTEVRVADPDATGAGEVLVRSPMVMQGYWQRPDADARAIDPDGWFSTGDIGRIDDKGYLFLVDRADDKVVTKGENVYPGEVERVLAEHPAVAEVAVVGVPDDEHGELLCAVVAAVPGTRPDLDELQSWCRGRLAGFKLPRRLELVAELPRTPSGKVLRRVVREPFWADHDRRVN